MAEDERDVALRVGHEELRIRGVYETISIINDVMAHSGSSSAASSSSPRAPRRPARGCS
ncbi:hypothetical protein [Curtobacterium flaccumfaciens]|uniref:hypothetical protein n=1 Tax=Curtobacterium flaccumfaciens TaxID=2035 RepID=UPI0027DFC146|nr:hypothetical protein [Curtobacterium flaccumfaciens]